MRERVGEQIFGTQLIADRAIQNVLSSLPALMYPTIGACIKSLDTLLHLWARAPREHCLAIQCQEQSFAELLHRGKPRWLPAQGRSAHSQADVLELIGDDRRRLKPGEAIQTCHLSQTMDCYQR